LEKIKHQVVEGKKKGNFRKPANCWGALGPGAKMRGIQKTFRTTRNKSKKQYGKKKKDVSGGAAQKVVKKGGTGTKRKN